MKLPVWLATAGLLLAVSQAQAATGTLLRSETLRSQPSATASAAGQVGKGTSVTVLSKKGGWMQVRAASQTGWVRLLSVRVGSSGGGAGVGDVVGAATKKSDSSRVVAVAGLRGLNEEDLKKASYDAAQITKLDGYAVSQSAADAYARKGKLASIKVSELPDPDRQSSSR